MRLRKFQSFAPGAVLVHRTPVFMVCMGSYDHKPQFKSGVVPKIVCQLLSKVFSADRRGVPGDFIVQHSGTSEHLLLIYRGVSKNTMWGIGPLCLSMPGVFFTLDRFRMSRSIQIDVIAIDQDLY